MATVRRPGICGLALELLSYSGYKVRGPAVSGGFLAYLRYWQKEAIMGTVTYIESSEGFGTSFSGTVNLPQQFPAAVAQVALANVIVDNSGYCQVFLTGYSANGNPVSVTDGSVVLGIQNVDSFSWEGSASQSVVASIMVYCFE
jgi:hypothetical protein